MPDTTIMNVLLRAMPFGTLQAAARLEAIDRLAQEMAITCTPEDLQAFADSFRVDHGILSKDDTISWLAGRGLTLDNWSSDLETRLLQARLLEHPSIEARARAFFEADPSRCAKINAGVIVVEDEGIAQEIHLLLRETRTSFDTVARRYSILFADGVSEHPLSRRVLFAGSAPEPVASAALSANFSGPFDVPPVSVGKLWHIYRLYTVENPVYDDETSDHLRRAVLEEALRPHIIEAFSDYLDRLGCERPDDVASLAYLNEGQRYLAALRHDRPERTSEAVRIERRNARADNDDAADAHAAGHTSATAGAYSGILRRFSDFLALPAYAAQRQRNLALLVKMRAHNLAVRQDRGRDWEHIHTALHVRESYPCGARILDVGGGGSLFSYEMALSGYDVTVIDIDPHAVAAVQANARALGIADRLRAEWVVGHQPWGHPDASFDAIVSISVFEGLTQRQRRRFFAEVHRTLKPRGELFLTFDYGPGARLLGDPPIDTSAVMDDIVGPSGLELVDPPPFPPDSSALPMFMILPDIAGMDFTAARYSFGAVRLRKVREAGPPFPDPAPTLVLRSDGEEPAHLLEVLASAPEAGRSGPLVVAFEIIDETAPRHVFWIASESGAHIEAASPVLPDVVLSATSEVLTQLLMNPEGFWALYNADVLLARGDISVVLRFLDCLPVPVSGDQG